MRNVATTVLEVVGLGAICVGALILSTPLGLIVSGAVATTLGYLLAASE